MRGIRIGTIHLEREQGAKPWSTRDVDLVGKIAHQIALALENARLMDEVKRRAERERLASEITAKVRASNDPQIILQTAIKELRQVLQAPKAQILVFPTDELMHETPSDSRSSSQEELSGNGNGGDKV